MFVVYSLARQAGPREGWAFHLTILPDDSFAIGYAAEQILLGHADAMLAGGTEAPLQPVVLAQLRAAGVLGFHEEASRTCRPT